jgi:hypothetical protein
MKGKNHKMKVTGVSTMAYDNHRIDLEGDDINASITVKDQNQFHQLSIGDVITIGVGVIGKLIAKGKARKAAKRAAADKSDVPSQGA